MSLLLADVSGFTALTRKLAAEGATGAEQVSAALDQVFGGILEVVEAFHGMPVASAGDSILIAWPAALCGGMEEASSVADECASGILQQFQEGLCVRQTTLSVHIGRANGWAEAVHLGDRDRHLVLIGPAVTSVGRAASRARPGALMSEAATQDEVPLHAGGGQPPSGSSGLDQLPSYVPRVVAQRVTSGHGDWLADLRRVSVVFVGLPGLEAAPATSWHDIVSLLDGVAIGFEGELHHLMVDDKGASGILAFGLPPAAHEDDSRRAVLAAQRLAVHLETRGMAANMGVATGPVFSGPVGSATWRRYTVIGDSVNLAARLMSLSRGVVCDETTARVSSGLSFEPAGLVELKGFSRPVPTFRPTSNRTTSSDDDSGPIVGRAPERQVLDTALQEAKAGNGGVVVVEADAGLGKSRLVAHLARQARRAGGDPVVVEADAVEARVPFHAWSHLVEEPERGPTEGEHRDLVVAQIAGRIAATSRPWVLIAEDTHWFDSGSWSVLVALRATLPELLLVLTTRPADHLQGDEARLRADATARVLHLGPLEEGDAEAILSEVVGSTSIQPLLLERLARRSEGNPYFLKEVARALVETGSVVVRDGVARLAPGAEAVLEQTGAGRLDSVIVARLDRLAPAEQLTAKVASVIGRAFQYRAVQAVYPVDSDRRVLSRCLVELERAQLTEQQPTPGSYAFCHAITRDAAYSLLSAAQRRQLHADVADWLERSHEGDPTRIAAVLAYHRDRAGDVAAARRHYEVAGDHALAVCAYREASAAYERILELVDDPTARERERLRLATRLGFAHLGHGDMPRAYEDFGAALAQGRYRLNASAPVLLGHLFKEIVVHLRHERMRTIAPGTERDPLVAMGAMHCLCSSYATVSVLGPAPYVLFRTANVAAASAHPVDLAEAYSCLAMAAATTPLKRLARYYLRRAKEVASGLEEGRDAEHAQAVANLAEAMTSVWLGQPAAALSASVAAHDALMAAGQRRRAADTVCISGFAAFWAGDFAAAESVARTLWEESGLDENEQMQAYSAIARTLTALASGDSEEAGRVVSSLVALDDSGVADQEKAFRLAVHALVRHTRGEDVSAELDTAARLMAADRMLTVPGRWQIYAILAGISLERALTVGSRERTLAWRVGLRGLRRYRRVLPVAEPGCFRLMAMDAWVRGQRRSAIRRLDRARQSARRLGMSHQEALVELSAGELYASAGDSCGARVSLARAEKLFQAIGAYGDAARARHLVASLESE